MPLPQTLATQQPAGKIRKNRRSPSTSGSVGMLPRWSRRVLLMGAGTASAMVCLAMLSHGSVAAGSASTTTVNRAMAATSANGGVGGEANYGEAKHTSSAPSLSATENKTRNNLLSPARVPFLPPAMVAAVVQEPQHDAQASSTTTDAELPRAQAMLASAVFAPVSLGSTAGPAASTDAPGSLAVPAAASVGPQSGANSWNSELLHAVQDDAVANLPVTGAEASDTQNPSRTAKPRSFRGKGKLLAMAMNNASRTETVWMEVTAYCPCQRCCGEDAQGITASGKPVSYNRGKFVAADTDMLPFGTRLSIPGYNGGQQVEVIDRGGAIRGNRLDVYFPSHAVAKQWGRRWVPVVVYADGE